MGLPVRFSACSVGADLIDTALAAKFGEQWRHNDEVNSDAVWYQLVRGLPLFAAQMIKEKEIRSTAEKARQEWEKALYMCG